MPLKNLISKLTLPFLDPFWLSVQCSKWWAKWGNWRLCTSDMHNLAFSKQNTPCMHHIYQFTKALEDNKKIHRAQICWLSHILDQSTLRSISLSSLKLKILCNSCFDKYFHFLLSLLSLRKKLLCSSLLESQTQEFTSERHQKTPKHYSQHPCGV
jgi:hypothetical protein